MCADLEHRAQVHVGLSTCSLGETYEAFFSKVVEGSLKKFLIAMVQMQKEKIVGGVVTFLRRGDQVTQVLQYSIPRRVKAQASQGKAKKNEI